MYRIIVKGEAKTSYPNLKELDSIDCQDNFSDYFDKTSWSDDVEGGYMKFKFEEGKLWTYTIYNSNRELSYGELEELMDYTQGQWSDGIGEGFEQFPCFTDDEDKEVFISPWFYGQDIEITQEKI